MSPKGPSQATLLVELAADVELFSTPRQEGYVAIESGGHREIWPLRTKPFKTWLARRFYVRYEKAPGSQALQDALAVLEGKALFDAPIHDVGVRVAEHEGAIYVDLADDYWQAVRVDTDGWQVVADPSIRFRRPPAMRELAAPVAGGSVDELRAFVNVGREDWPLVVGWLLAALRPRGPYPVLTVNGEQGAAKTTTVRVLRELVDPNEVGVRSQPRDERDLMIAARNGHVLAFDNLSYLPNWLSDAFCRIATGGGLATRTLYTDFDETLFEAQRPLTINGIAEIAFNGDLLDRSLIVTLPRIPKHQRRQEEAFWAELRPQTGRLLGALLDAVVVGLRRSAELHLEELPRMADFAHWVAACEPALRWPAQTFLSAYEVNSEGAVTLALEASLLSTPIRVLAEIGFEGTATELLNHLEREHIDEETKYKKAWPKAPNALGDQLRRLAPNLRATGISVEFEKVSRGRLIRLAREKAVSAVHAVQTDSKDSDDGKSHAQSKGFREALDVDQDEIERLAALAVQAQEQPAVRTFLGELSDFEPRRTRSDPP